MPLPTLLREGFIVPNSKFSKREKTRIKDMKSIDYIMEFIGDRTPRVGGLAPKIQPKTAGDKVIVLKSDTGSGKSTVLAPYLYETFQSRTRKSMAITQPRVLTAVDIATGLPEFYPFLELDKNLGYSTGAYKRLPTDAGLIFMTIGTLLQHIQSYEPDKFMRKYSYILIDEVHERDMNVDMTLFLLKKFLSEYYDDINCPMIILMSATFDPNTFMDFFNCPNENYIQVVGSTFPIEANFLKYESHDYIQTAVDRAEKIHVENITDITNDEQFRDIILFVSGAGPSKKILEKLHVFNSSVLSKSFDDVKQYISDKKVDKHGVHGGSEQFYIAPIDLSRSSYNASGDEYQNLFSDIKDISIPIYKTNGDKLDKKTIIKWVNPTRRVIVATPIAETGVTIDTLKYCIDTGFATDVSFNPDYGVKTLTVSPITRGMATQRRGRVGRKAPGIWYPCYTEKTFKKLQEDQFAKMLTSDVTEELMNIIITETDSQIMESHKREGFITHKLSDNSFYTLMKNNSLNMSKVDFLESPSSSSLVYSTEKLRILGFIDNEYNPTVLGLYSQKIGKISMENKRLLFASFSHGANTLDIITAIAFIQVGKRYVFHRKYKPINMTTMTDKEWEFYYKIVICDEIVEFILVWELYSEMLDKYITSIKKKVDKGSEYVFDVSRIKKWCDDNKILYDGLLWVSSVRDEIIENVISAGINPYYNGMGLEKGSYNLLTMLRKNLDDFVDEVKKIKKCVLDGYRCNLIVWDDIRKKHILKHRNIPVFIRSNVMTRMGDDAAQRNANFMISTDFLFMKSFMGKGFGVESTGALSVLDPYLNIDLNFMDG